MDISARINRRLAEHRLADSQIDHLLEVATSPARFDSQDSLRMHLAEGALLNVTRIASDCLSIPSGKYVVWLTDSGRTVLVPSRDRAAGVYAKNEDMYELHTAKLLGMWNKLERSISEDGEQGRSGNWRDGNEAQDISGHFDTAPEQIPDEPYTFGTKIGRPALWQAMQRANIGVTELANAVGVDKSTISRLLRDVQAGPGDPHGRNPSVAVAQKIASVLGVDVNEVLPPPEDLHVSNRKATSGSGAGGGKNVKQMTQGGNGGKAAAQESRVRSLARLMAECRVDPVQTITESLIGIATAEPVLNEFLKGMVNKLGFGKKDPAAADKANGDKLFDTAITAINALIKTYGRVNGAGGFTARVGDKKMALDQWLASISHNLNLIKAKMPEVQAKHQRAALAKANEKAAAGEKDAAAQPKPGPRPEYTTGKNGIGMSRKPKPVSPQIGSYDDPGVPEGRRPRRPLNEFDFSKGSRLGGGIPSKHMDSLPMGRMGFTGGQEELAGEFQDDQDGEFPGADWSDAIDDTRNEIDPIGLQAHWDKTIGIERDAEGQTPEEIQ